MRTARPSPVRAVGLLVAASMYPAEVGDAVGAPDCFWPEPDIHEDPARCARTVNSVKY